MIALFDINNKHHELIKFDQATGVTFTNELLKSHLPDLVDLRDIFVNLMIGKYSFDEIGEMINKDRTSIYNSVERFKYRYETYSEYKALADETFKQFNNIYMKQFFIYQDKANCFYCTEIESEIKGWILVGTFTGYFVLHENLDFEEFKSGSVIELTNKKNVKIDSINWIMNFTLNDFKNFNFKYGQKVLTKGGDVLSLIGVNFNIEMYEDGNLIDTLDEKDGGRRWLCLEEILQIYYPQ